MRKARHIRELLKLDLKDVEAITGIIYSNLSRFETGERNLRLGQAVKLADFYSGKLGVTVDVADLMKEEDNANT